MPARTRRSRQRSVRSLLALILIFPAGCMLALWAVAARVTVSQASQARDFRSAEALYAGPGQALAAALAAERLQAVSWLSGGRRGAVAPLRLRFQATDNATAAFLSAVRASGPAIPASAWPALTTAESALARRAALRASVTAGRLTPLAAAQAYSTIMTAELNLDAGLVAAGDTPLYRQAAATVEAERAVDLMSGEVALATTAGSGGAISTTALVLLARDVAGQRLLMADALAQFDPGLRVGYRLVLASAAHRAVAVAEDRIAAGADRQAGPELVAAAVPVLRGYRAAEREDLAVLTGLATQAGNRWLLASVLVGGAGPIVVVVLIGLMIWFGWRISRGLTSLQRAAASLAAEGLPGLTRDPGEARSVPVATGGARTIREIAGTAEALAAVWRTAVQAAAEGGTQRSAASALVRNAALRCQPLLRRQLSTIGDLELDATEPPVLARLAAVRRLARHMQRHADGLVVLAGDVPDRVRHGPLPVGEVLRAAAAELDGPQVHVVAECGDAVAATAAGDVIQLVAELTEYACRDTLPETEITLRAGRVGRGLAIEVENRAGGLGEPELDSANVALAGSTAAGLPSDDQLGLHVAGRLAARHEITVTLRRSPVGGTVAVALLPHAILVAATARDTIADGSLPRVDVSMPPAELAPWPADAWGAASRPASAGEEPSSSATPAAPRSAVAEPAAASTAADVPAVEEPVAGTAARIPSVGEPSWDSTAARVPAVAKPPTAASPAPWYWLTASESAPRPAVEPPGSAAADPPPAEQGPPAPLPRRVRNASLAARPRPGGYDAGSQLSGDGGDEPPGGVGV